MFVNKEIGGNSTGNRLRSRTLRTQHKNAVVKNKNNSDMREDVQGISKVSSLPKGNIKIIKSQEKEIKKIECNPVVVLKRCDIHEKTNSKKETISTDKKKKKELAQTSTPKSETSITKKLNELEKNALELDELSNPGNSNGNGPIEENNSIKKKKETTDTLGMKRVCENTKPPNTSKQVNWNVNLFEENNKSFEAGKAEEMYAPENKKRKTVLMDDFKNCQVYHCIPSNFKERALTEQVPTAMRTPSKITHQGKTFNIDYFGNFPQMTSSILDTSLLGGTSFVNNLFAAGTLEMPPRKAEKSSFSKRHTYYVVLDGVAKFNIAGSEAILRLGDCCIVPKYTDYSFMNVSNEHNLLLNYFKSSA